MNQRELEQLLAPYPELMTVNEAATAMRVDPRSVQRWAKDGRLTAMRMGRNYRVPKTDVLRWMIAAHTRPEATPSITPPESPGA